MRKRLFIYSMAIIFCLSGCLGKKNGMPDLRETFAAKDSKPFGGAMALNILRNSFPGREVERSKVPFSDAVNTFFDTASVYCNISKNLILEERDVEQMMDYVYKGNTVFLSSYYFDSLLMEKLNCRVSRDPFDIFKTHKDLSDVELSLLDDAGFESSVFKYFYYPFNSYFSSIDDEYSRIMGYNSSKEPNCIVYFWGKGKFFLHTDPKAFSNYFLLTQKNYLYFQSLLQLMPEDPTNVYWSDYYYSHNFRNQQKSRSSFSELLKYPPLTWAFWLTLLLLLLYILFGGKRKQRIIKQTAPNKNSSIAFAETIGRLYMQHKDNKNIADKMITYFNEHIRSHYFIYSPAGSEDFIQTLSRKSGLPVEKTTALYQIIGRASVTEQVDDEMLLSLNDQIQQFYKNRI